MASNIAAQLKAVTVPDDVQPGARFTAPVTVQRKGAKIVEEKALWRASGNMPAVQSRRVVPGTGQRHAQRPSALAKAALGPGGLAVDHVTATAYTLSFFHPGSRVLY